MAAIAKANGVSMQRDRNKKLSAPGRVSGDSTCDARGSPAQTLVQLAQCASPRQRRSYASSGDSLDDTDGVFSPFDSLHTRSLDALRTSLTPDDYRMPFDGEKASPNSAAILREALGGLSNLEDFDREKIGAGFYGDVYKVIQRSTGRVLVLKMNRFIDSQNRARNLTETEVMRNLKHPNVLQFIGACISEGNIHPLVEYVNGGNLEDLLCNEKRVLSWLVKLQLACDIAGGMAYLHSQGIVHRDLTSKNCLLKDLGQDTLVAVVADFGLVAKFGNADSGRSPYLSKRLRKASSVVGSPYWMAPEVLNGKAYNEKADVFSYGIVMCEIIARVNADPDELPRTSAYGLDENAFTKMCHDLQCPDAFLGLAFHCCQIDATERPNFPHVHHLLDGMVGVLEDGSDEEDKDNLAEVEKEAVHVEDVKVAEVCESPDQPDGAVVHRTTPTIEEQYMARRRSLHRKTLSMGGAIGMEHYQAEASHGSTNSTNSTTAVSQLGLPVIVDLERSHSAPGSPRLSPALTPRRTSLRFRIHADSISTPSRCVDALRLLRQRNKRRVDSDSDDSPTSPELMAGAAVTASVSTTPQKPGKPGDKSQTR